MVEGGTVVDGGMEIQVPERDSDHLNKGFGLKTVSANFTLSGSKLRK